METKQETKVTREQIINLDIIGYLEHLYNIPQILKTLIDIPNEEERKRAKYNEIYVKIGLDIALLYSRYSYNLFLKNKEKRTDEQITNIEKIQILYPIISKNIDILKHSIKSTSKKIEDEKINKRFILNVNDAYINEFEQKEYYFLPHLLEGRADPRILDPIKIRLLGHEIAELLFFYEIATPIEEDAHPMLIRDRYKLLMKYHKISDDNFKELSLRNRAPIYAKILNASPETLRKILSDELQNKL